MALPDNWRFPWASMPSGGQDIEFIVSIMPGRIQVGVYTTSGQQFRTASPTCHYYSDNVLMWRPKP
jgi:hypothetical protein